MRFELTLRDAEPTLDTASEDAVVRVGRALYEGRVRAGLSQRGLARRVGIDQATISRLERGRSPYSRLSVVARLLAELDLIPAGSGSRRDRGAGAWLDIFPGGADADA